MILAQRREIPAMHKVGKKKKKSEALSECKSTLQHKI